MGVDEKEVHASWLQRLAQVGSTSMPAPRLQVDSIGETGALELALGEIGVPGLVLDRDQPAIGSQPSGDPDPGVPGQRPDLDGQPAPVIEVRIISNRPTSGPTAMAGRPAAVASSIRPARWSSWCAEHFS